MSLHKQALAALQDRLESLSPPSSPDQSFRSATSTLSKIRIWNLQQAVALVAGLGTLPELHGNSTRIDWLQRIVLTRARGQYKPTTADVQEILNGGLVEASVAALEDPIEDLFCDTLPTNRGNFRIFPGQWTYARTKTQILLSAFESASRPDTNQSTLNAVYSLLRISEAVAERSHTDRNTHSISKPGVEISVPSSEDRIALASRVQFTEIDLRAMNVNPPDLERFLLRPQDFSSIGSSPVGSSPLDVRPLIRFRDIICVASVETISLAIRATLVREAKPIHFTLNRTLQRAQALYAARGGFWPRRPPPLSQTSHESIRETHYEYDNARYLQILQVSLNLDDITETGFAEARSLGKTGNTLLTNSVREFWKTLNDRSDVRSSTTAVLICGWGPTFIVELTIDDSEPPSHWNILWLSSEEAFILGSFDDGKFVDILRMNKQEKALEVDRMFFNNLGSLLNLYKYWSDNGYRLVPPSVKPSDEPKIFVIDPSYQFDAIREITTRRNDQALHHPDEGFKVVNRIGSDESGLKHIYVSEGDAESGTLCGAYSLDTCTWWITVSQLSSAKPNYRFKIWDTVLRWIDKVGHLILARHGDKFSEDKRIVELFVPEFDRSSQIAPKDQTLDSEDAVISVEKPTDRSTATVIITSAWIPYLMLPSNAAEVHLIAAVLYALCDADGGVPSRDEFAASVRDIIGTSDWRCIHSRSAVSPLERLKARGLISTYIRPSRSAGPVVAPSLSPQVARGFFGTVITDPTNAEGVLSGYLKNALASLVSDLRRFSRRHVAVECSRIYQAALSEQEDWRISIRALRVIKGDKANRDAFDSQNDINEVRRASKIIAEMSACEGGSIEALNPGRADMEELYSKASLVIRFSQTLSGVRSGVFRPTIAVGPVGDLIIREDPAMELLSPSAEWLNGKILDEAATRYVRDGDPERKAPEDVPDWYGGLCLAIESEYHVAFSVYREFPSVLCQIAEESGSSVLLIRKSDLLRALCKSSGYTRTSTVDLLDRLILKRRDSWFDGLTTIDQDVSRLDRAMSLINRPILEVESDIDPLLLIDPALVSEASVYSISNLVHGLSNGRMLSSRLALQFAGKRGMSEGVAFQQRVASLITDRGAEVQIGWKVSNILNQKVDQDLGDIDVLVVNHNKSLVWAIEAKNLRVCRTPYEIASRVSQYLGNEVTDRRGKQRPDKLLRHIRRVEYLRLHAVKIMKRFGLSSVPSVEGLLVFDSPHPVRIETGGNMNRVPCLVLEEVSSFEF